METVEELREIDPLAKCDCGTQNAAMFWCHVHGYLIKPPVVRRKPVTQQVSEVVSAKPDSEEHTASLLESVKSCQPSEE